MGGPVLAVSSGLGGAEFRLPILVAVFSALNRGPGPGTIPLHADALSHGVESNGER
jgi:hypothetical protein